jgi:hypothetical protein
MTGGIRVFLTFAACALAIPAAGQAPAPTTTAFDGKYFGTATIAASKAAEFCTTLALADMTITGGQVVIYLTDIRGPFQGSVNTGGEVSTSLYRTIHERVTVNSLSGIIHDKVFTGQHLYGRLCAWNVQMTPAPPPTMPFDGDFIGVSRESRSSKAKCAPSDVPGTLIIRNSVALGRWQGTVSPQGILSLRSPYGTPIAGQIDSQGIIRGQDTSDVGCSSIWVWRKQAG